MVTRSAKGKGMISPSGQSLLAQALHHKVILVVESRTQLAQALDHTVARPVMLRHCSLFELVYWKTRTGEASPSGSTSTIFTASMPMKRASSTRMLCKAASKKRG